MSDENLVPVPESGSQVEPAASDDGAPDIAGEVVRSVVAGGDMRVTNSMAALLSAQRDVHASGCGGTAIVAGRNVRVSNGGACLLVAGRNGSVARGFVGTIISRRSRVENSTVGLILGGKTSLREGSRVLLNGPQALLLGAGIGAGFAIVTALLGGGRAGPAGGALSRLCAWRRGRRG